MRFQRLAVMGEVASDVKAPNALCSMKVAVPMQKPDMKKGTFSNMSRRDASRRLSIVRRRSGQQSSSNMTNGRVTSIVLLINPSTKKNSASQ